MDTVDGHTGHMTSLWTLPEAEAFAQPRLASQSVSLLLSILIKLANMEFFCVCVCVLCVLLSLKKFNK